MEKSMGMRYFDYSAPHLSTFHKAKSYWKHKNLDNNQK